MPDTDAVVANYGTHGQAEEAVRQLQQGGFDMTKLSIIGKGYHTDEHVVGYYNTGDRVKFWGKQGAFWGGLWGFLVGSAFFWVPGIGPLVVGGPLVTWIIGALEGAIVGGGLGVIGSALYSIGIPKDSIVEYESAVKAGEYLLVAHGTADEAAKAKSILQTAGGAKSVVQHQVQPQPA
jgi:hypothetical protein